MEFIKVKNKHRKPSDWYDLVKQWHSSGDSQQSFCTKHNLYAKTFSRWVCEHRKLLGFDAVKAKALHQHKPVTPSVSVSTPSAAEKPSVQFVELCTENFNLKVPLSATEAEWKKLFSSLRVC